MNELSRLFPHKFGVSDGGRGKGRLMAAVVMTEGKQFPDYYLISPLYIFNVIKFQLRFSKTLFSFLVNSRTHYVVLSAEITF